MAIGVAIAVDYSLNWRDLQAENNITAEIHEHCSSEYINHEIIYMKDASFNDNKIKTFS